jgi:hypothetical protein
MFLSLTGADFSPHWLIPAASSLVRWATGSMGYRTALPGIRAAISQSGAAGASIQNGLRCDPKPLRRIRRKPD